MHDLVNTLLRLRAINEKAQGERQATKIARAEVLESFLTSLAASGEVSIIVVRAYTPWREDEPQHVANFFVNVKEIIAEGIEEDNCGLELPAELISRLQAEDRWSQELRRMVDTPGAHDANVELCASYGHVYDPPSESVFAAIEELIFKTAELEGGTDYFVSYVLKDGQFEVMRGSYTYSE
ncbi:hypothetical protein JP74_18550 [Devosia sp. 17-2-E-8]|nr:hypothetical protein JP74_18550 [Devosia sp. 17-2-E-8]